MKTQTDAVALLQKTSALARSQDATAKFDVTGGIFSSNPTQYLAEGYEANKADDKYTVAKKQYAINVGENIENGKVEVDPVTAAKGDEVTITATPADGYELATLYVTDGTSTLPVTGMKFTMPASDVTVTATFKRVYTITTKAEHGTVTVKDTKLTIDPETATGTPVWKSSNEKVVTVDGGKLKAVGTGVAAVTVTLGDQRATCEVSVICSTKACEKYTDVDADEWYHPAVDYVTDNKIMKGIGPKLYGPKLDLTRAQLAQILYNLEAEPKNGETELTLTDVDTEEWYAAAVKWAASNEIVKGYPNKTFRPDDSVTRQDMVTMIARYAAYKKLTLVTDDSWKDFKDYEDVGEWAEDAMAWAVANGLVNGMTADTLVPNGTATRGQIAKIMMMFNSTYAVK